MLHRKLRHSIAGQLTVSFIGLILLIVAINLLVNNVFLERFYTYTLEKSLIRVYEMIDSHVTEDSVDRDYFVNTISGECNSNNMSLLVVDSSFHVLAQTSSASDNLMMARLNGYILDVDRSEKILKQTQTYTIQRKLEPLLNIYFLEMWGTLGSGGYFMLRIPFSSIRVNARISNTFLFYFSIVALIAGILLALFLARRISRPVRELTELSSRMADLDFEARYQSGGEDEIGQLGAHFNQMSETLEKTISRLKSANNQLQLDIERKDQVDLMRREFLANVSHELKTPLALIQGYAEGLAECVNEDEESRTYYCEVIGDEASKMSAMVGKLMSLNELEEGYDLPEMTRFDIAQLIDGKIQSIGVLAQQKDISVRYLGRSQVWVWGDEFKTEEVLTNYLSNALNHAEGENRIEIREQMQEDKVRISVFNTGRPIPEEDLGRIWDKFYKVDKARTREYGGSGVGLSIVKAIMEAMHQEYGVVNHPDGVEFYFTLEDASGVTKITET